MGHVAIRTGLPADIEAAISVYLASREAHRTVPPIPTDQIERLRISLRNPDSIFLVSEDAETCVGMALAMQSRENDGAGPLIPGVCFIAMIYVASDRWGEGIGGRLVDTILREATTRGYSHTQLWTQGDNSRAHRLYERHGFSRSGRTRINDRGEQVVEFERPAAP